LPLFGLRGGGRRGRKNASKLSTPFASNVLVQLEQTAAREAIAMTHAEAAPGS
jgi:hypothetical protein